MANAIAEDAYKCPQGHELSPVGLPYQGCTCDNCGMLLPMERCSFSCAPCKYIVCEVGCVGSPPDSDRSIPGVPRCRNSAGNCREFLEWTEKDPDGWQCWNNCLARQTNRGDWRWHCPGCAQDVCQRCVDARHKGGVDDGHVDTPRARKKGRNFLNMCRSHKWQAALELAATNPGLINYKVEGRWTALHYAARAGHIPTIKRMLELGANPVAYTTDSTNPFDVVREESVRKLMIQRCFLDPAFKIFKTFDANNGGSIDTAELSWVLKSVLPDMSAKDLDSVFKGCDHDGNGEIDFCELVDWLYNGSGRTMMPEILAAAESIAASGEVMPADCALAAEQSKPGQAARIVCRSFLSEDIFRDSEGYDHLTNFIGQPPTERKRAVEHVKDFVYNSSSTGERGLRPFFESLLRIDETLEQADHLNRLKCTTQSANVIGDDDMMWAIILYTFDLSLFQQDDYPVESNFRFLCNELIRERNAELLSLGHGFFYNLMTGLDRLPPTTGVVWQIIPESKAEEALETLQLKNVHYWSTFTIAEKLFKSVMKTANEYDLLLSIKLLPKTARHPSKSREIAEANAVSGTNEVLLLPNIRLRVERESTKQNWRVLELTELVEDYNLTLRAQDFDDCSS